ncbi:MAG: hypothetical protein P8Z38_09030 [Robiginitalea sp.]
MAPVEFEKELRKRLRSREARPSKEAWDRIASRLEVQEPVSGQRRSRWWIGLAAASVVLLAALAFFWEQPELSEPAQPIVKTPGVEAPEPEKQKEDRPIDMIPESDRTAIATTTVERESEASYTSTESTTEGLVTRVKRNDGALLQKVTPSEGSRQSPSGITREPDPAYTELAVRDKGPEPVSDAQIDSLLRRAQQAIAGEDSSRVQPAVDPSLLLSEAEDELDQTFREKIMEKIKSGVTRVRTGVAQRNK